ncbi:unnamed protein product, partial [marine sediment metagenome]
MVENIMTVSEKEVFDTEREYFNNVKIENIPKVLSFDKEGFFFEANRDFNKLLTKIEGKRVLDVCCGNGSLSFALARKGAIVTGIDLSSNFITHCKQMGKLLNLNVDFKIMNAQAPQFKEKFDAIMGYRAIHHLPNLEKAFNNYSRLLTKDGWMLFLEPLKYNPIVEFNRKILNPDARTKYEHPLTNDDVAMFNDLTKDTQIKY